MAPKPSKRDWFRNKLVVRSPSPLPARPAPRPAAAATRTSSSEPTYTRNGSNILADALEALDREDRETIRTLLPTNVFTIDAAFDEVHGVVSELGELCANKRWSWTYKGHKVYVHDQVDKVVQLLDKFKSVGDVVANVDPIHVGLPWAGIRLILEVSSAEDFCPVTYALTVMHKVALSDRHQRAILVTGMELSFHISNRLKVYLDAYARASPSLASDNFRRSVVNLYAHILRFLGCAIRIQQKSAVSRTAQALWDTSDLTRFEERCDTLCSRAGEEARICDSGESLRIQLQSLQEIDKIHGSLSRLQDKADLAKLITAAGATYDSYAEGELPRCLPGTRIELLKLINDWATDPAGQRMFWLCGVAGTGKSTIARTVGDASQRNIRTAEFQHIVGSIILLSNPLSTTALSSLLVISRPEIVKVLQPLSSVLNIPWTADGRIHPTTPITLFHLSFRDFLLDASLKDENKFWIDARKMHGILGTQCVRLLDYGTLREDICAVNNPGTRRAEVAKSTVHDSLPEAVAYACRYWVQHVVDSGEHVTDVGAVYPFLEKHLLHWMEALSWLGRASDIIHGLRALRSVTSAQSGTQLLSLLDDAIRLALSNRYIIDHAPLQTYVSALLFAPSQSIVRRMFAGGLRKYFKTMPRVPERWGAEMQKLEGHKRRLTSLAFSPDGKTLMSGSKDCAVIWDVATGEEMQKYEHETGVSDVAFSQDGNTLALYLGDSIVLRDTATGEVTQKLIGHHGEVTAAVFSLDSKTLSSTSKDSTIRLWDVATGKEMQKQELAQPIENESLVFSSDNRTIAYGSGECVLIQEAATGVEKQKLVGHTSVITAVAFLLDGRTVVSGSWDMTVRLWDIEIGKEKQKFIGHTQSVLCVAGSLDSRTIASGSVDRTVRLWDARTGIQKQSFTGHSDAIVAIAFSAGGKTIASGSWDMTVRLWDATMSEETQKLEGPEDSGPSLNNPITAMCVSLDGQMIVSGSWDGTIRLWDVATGEETQRPLVTNAQYIKAVDLSPDLEILAFGSMYGAFGLSDPQLGTTRLWDADTGEEIDEVSDAMRSRKGRDVGFIKISPHSKTILITTERDEMIDEAVRLWDVATEKEMQRFQLSSTEDIEEGILHEVLTAVAFSLDSTTVATGSAVQLVASGPWDGTVRLWDAASGKLTDIRCSKLHRYPRWMRFTNDGSALDTDVGRVDLSLPCGLGQASPPPITEVSMSSDYQWVQCDGSDVLWLPHGYRDHSRRAFASHGALIAVGREDGTVSCFSFEPWFGIT
ncbi:hypothetical protein LTR02_003916 [Friedmanniomyces endolithicus]|nr:hypothetical protein LTR02_003916 [Friedmanniomyces endolithicus]